MIPIAEFYNRSKAGKAIDSAAFDELVMDAMMDLVEEHDLEIDLDAPICTDEVADAVFEAAIDFLSQVGVYNMTTKHVIPFTRDEVEEIVRDYRDNPRVFTIGRDVGERTVAAREPGDGRSLLFWPAIGMVPNVEALRLSLRLFANEPNLDGLMTPSMLPEVDGIRSEASTVGEMHVMVAQARVHSEELAAAGNEGLFRALVGASSAEGALVAMRPGLLEPWNCMIGVHITPEMKIDNGRLSCAYAAEQLGVQPWISSMSMMGGICGGPEGAAVSATANVLAQLAYAHGSWATIQTNDMQGSHSTRMTVAAQDAARRAVVRNLKIATSSTCVDACEATCLEEAVLSSFIVGFEVAAGGGAIDWFAGGTPLAARLHHTGLNLVAAMGCDASNAVLSNLLAAKEKLRVAHEGQKSPFPACLPPAAYDLASGTPHDDYRAAVEVVAEMIREAGVPLPDDCLE